MSSIRPNQPQSSNHTHHIQHSQMASNIPQHFQNPLMQNQVNSEWVLNNQQAQKPQSVRKQINRPTPRVRSQVINQQVVPTQTYSRRGDSQQPKQAKQHNNQLIQQRPSAQNQLITQVSQGDMPISLPNPQLAQQLRFQKEAVPLHMAAIGPQMPHSRGKKTLVLDLDETLVHSSFKAPQKPDIILPIEIEGNVCQVYVVVRPGTELFLQRLSKIYEVVIYTASLSKYADPLIDIIDSHSIKTIDHRMFREHCTFYSGVFIKDMSILGRNLTDLIIIDNSPTSYAFHQENALPILSWYEDPSDKCLFELIPLLEALAEVDDVRKYIPHFVSIDHHVDFQRAGNVLANAVQRKPIQSHGNDDMKQWEQLNQDNKFKEQMPINAAGLEEVEEVEDEHMSSVDQTQASKQQRTKQNQWTNESSFVQEEIEEMKGNTDSATKSPFINNRVSHNEEEARVIGITRIKKHRPMVEAQKNERPSDQVVVQRPSTRDSARKQQQEAQQIEHQMQNKRRLNQIQSRQNQLQILIHSERSAERIKTNNSYSNKNAIGDELIPSQRRLASESASSARSFINPFQALTPQRHIFQRNTGSSSKQISQPRHEKILKPEPTDAEKQTSYLTSKRRTKQGVRPLNNSESKIETVQDQNLNRTQQLVSGKSIWNQANRKRLQSKQRVMLTNFSNQRSSESREREHIRPTSGRKNIGVHKNSTGSMKRDLSAQKHPLASPVIDTRAPYHSIYNTHVNNMNITTFTPQHKPATRSRHIFKGVGKRNSDS